MRPAWILLSAPILSCTPRAPCDLEALGAAVATHDRAAVAAAVTGSCRDVPAGLSAALGGAPLVDADAAVCAQGLTAGPRLQNRRLLSERCAWTGLATEDEVVFAAGEPALAFTTREWLVAHEVPVDQANAVAKALLGTPTWAPPFALGELTAGGLATTPPPTPTWKIDGATATGPGLPVDLSKRGDRDGAFGDWTLAGPTPTQSVVAVVSPTTPATHLFRFAASAVLPAGSLELLSRTADGDALSVISLALPQGEQRVRVVPRTAGHDVYVAGTRVPGAGACPPEGPTLCGPGQLAALLTAQGAVGAGVVVESAPNETVQQWLDRVAGLQIERPVVPVDEPGCVDGPSGMACVPGGTVNVVAGATVKVSTFWIDPKEMTVGDYGACVKAGYCTARSGAAEAPVTGLAWEDARRACSFYGKRLPTEWEWERAANRGPEGLAGIWTAPGEWTSSFESSSTSCTGCSGLDPKGACGGSQPCGGAGFTVVRGIPDKTGHVIPSARVAKAGADKSVGLRCVVDEPVLRAFPPAVFAAPLPVRGLPAAPTPEQLALASNLPQDSLEDKGVCGEDVRQAWDPRWQKGGHSMTFCRDPISYIVPNEKRVQSWRRYVENRGGGYLGVASDQNYNLVALARSDWAWFMDYDPNVVRTHKLLRALVLKSETRADFLAKFAPGAQDEVFKLLEEVYPGDNDVRSYQMVWGSYRARWQKYYQDAQTAPKDDSGYGWMSHDDQYAYIRTMHQQGRINILGGDMLAAKSMTSVGAAAKALGVPIRLYYTSNAPTAWGGQLTEQYRKNVAGLPMDEQSLILTTLNKGAFGQQDYWHYAVMDGLVHQRRITDPAYTRVFNLFWDRLPTDDRDVTVTGLPGSRP